MGRAVNENGEGTENVADLLLVWGAGVRDPFGDPVAACVASLSPESSTARIGCVKKDYRE